MDVARGLTGRARVIRPSHRSLDLRWTHDHAVGLNLTFRPSEYRHISEKAQRNRYRQMLTDPSRRHESPLDQLNRHLTSHWRWL